MNTVDVSLVGVGLSPRDHLTLEGLRALRASRRVFYAAEVTGLATLLAEEGVEGVDVTEHLAFGGTRGDAYQAIAELVVAASERGPVSWVTLGSPAVVCGVTTSIEAAAAARGRRTRRILAVSSLDLIASDLGLDVGRAGLTVLPALALVSCGARPDPRTGCIVMMVARAETALHVLDARLKPGALDRVAKALLEVYPESHPAILYTAASGDAPARRFDTTVGALAGSVEQVDPWSSLFVPPLSSPVPAEERELLFDFARAARLYETPLEVLLRTQSEGEVT